MQAQTYSDEYWFDFDCWLHRTAALKFNEFSLPLFFQLHLKELRACVLRVMIFKLKATNERCNGQCSNVPICPFRNRVREPFFAAANFNETIIAPFGAINEALMRIQRTNDMQSIMWTIIFAKLAPLSRIMNMNSVCTRLHEFEQPNVLVHSFFLFYFYFCCCRCSPFVCSLWITEFVRSRWTQSR